ncbi:MAG: hypothetical protein ACRCX2_22545 [Paraclostridium sp.]
MNVFQKMKIKKEIRELRKRQKECVYNYKQGKKAIDIIRNENMYVKPIGESKTDSDRYYEMRIGNAANIMKNNCRDYKRMRERIKKLESLL